MQTSVTYQTVVKAEQREKQNLNHRPNLPFTTMLRCTEPQQNTLSHDSKLAVFPHFLNVSCTNLHYLTALTVV